MTCSPAGFSLVKGRDRQLALFKAGLRPGRRAIAATACCPIRSLRMQADGVAEASKRRGYKNVFDAVYKIGSQEGVKALWREVVPTVTRGRRVHDSAGDL